MAVNNEGFAVAWGSGRRGERGDYTYDYSPFPMRVGPLPYRSLEVQESVLTKKDGTQITYRKNTSN